MPALAYARGAYKRSDLPEMRVVNQYVEGSPANPGDNAVLLPRPGMALSATVSAGPIRGLFSQPGVFGGDLFAVSGPALYRNQTHIGSISGALRVSIAATLNIIMIASDDALSLYDGTLLTTAAFPDQAGVSAVGYMNGYAVAVRAGTRHIYFTLDPKTWDGLDYFSAEQDTGAIVGIALVNDQLWVFCERVTEIFTSTGDATSPFQRVEGRVFDKGCLARDTIVKGDNTVFWVGNDRIAYRADATPARISNSGIEERLAESVTTDVGAWLFIWNGHSFYVLRTSAGTFCQDAETQEWCEFASFGKTNWRAHVGILRDGVTVAGDDTSGDLWTFSDAELVDGSDPIECVFTALLSGNQVIADNITLEAAGGHAAAFDVDPLIEMRKSRDGGNTFDAWRAASLGQRGQYRARPVWRRCGLIDDVTVIEFRRSDPTLWRLSSVSVNDSLAGRSR